MFIKLNNNKFMNKQELDVLNFLLQKSYVNQRILAEQTGHSVGVVNRSIKNLLKCGFLDDHLKPTKLAIYELKENSPKNAIILAAGFGMRMVPINTQVPKALLVVNGVPLIERIIKQLHDVCIKEIHVVVGFMKDQFEYLIDEYGVDLIVNEEYSEKNNLHSLALASPYISNSYIIPCDLWFKKNPFSKYELYSWYLVSDLIDDVSTVRLNRKKELVSAKSGNSMIGVAYLTSSQSEIVKTNLKTFDNDSMHNDDFWESALIARDRMVVHAKVVKSSEVVEINTYEQLRELDEDSNHLKSDAITVISSSLGVQSREITDIKVLKKGMTNRSFLFNCRNKKYIMRIPGAGTDQLINRAEEANVYNILKNKSISDNVIYINPYNGYKISSFFENSRTCDPNNQDDLKRCMKKLREFHNMKLKVEHEFDIYNQIELYEKLWSGKPSIYSDYKQTKEHVIELKKYINDNIEGKVLSHIDSVQDNFLFTENGDIKIIDWEYAGMHDPHVDIAMFCIYALYDRAQVDNIINIYFENSCPINIRIKIYCYIASCGLLWSNWCEYKRTLGVEFGEYSLRQYRYAKDYYKIAKSLLG